MSIKLTFGSILTTVTSTADALTGVVGAANSAIGMANRYVNAAAVKQQAEIERDLDQHEQVLDAQFAIEGVKRQIQINEFTSASALHKQLFEAELARIKAKFSKG